MINEQIEKLKTDFEAELGVKLDIEVNITAFNHNEPRRGEAEGKRVAEKLAHIAKGNFITTEHKGSFWYNVIADKVRGTIHFNPSKSFKIQILEEKLEELKEKELAEASR